MAAPDDATKLLSMLGKLSDGINKFVMAVPKLALNTAMGLPGRAAGISGGLASTGANPLGSIPGMIAKLVDPISNAFGGIASKIQGTMGPIVSMVDKFNPMLVQQFEFAINDLMAVMGDILQPILVAVTQVTRQLADTFKSMKPVFDPIIAGIVKMIGVLGKLIEPIAKVMIPVLNVIAFVIDKVIVPAFELLGSVLEKLARGVIWMVNQLINAWNAIAKTEIGKKLGLKGIDNLNYDEMLKKEDSAGAARRSVFRTSAEDLGARTREAAFGQVAWQQKLVDGQANANKMLEEIAGGIAGLKQSNEAQNDLIAQQLAQQMVG